MGLTQKLGTIPLAILTDSSNNVGIGGSANASFKLQVTGTTNLTGALSGTSATFSGALTSGAVATFTAAANPLILKSTSATTMYTEYYYNTSTLAGYIGSGSGILSGANNSDFIVRSEADFVVATGNNRRMTIASSTGAATFSSSVTIGGNGVVQNGNVLSVYRTDNTRAIQLYTTNDECVLESWQASSEPLHIRSFGSGGRIQFFTNATERMRITSGGNVGIGTSSPLTRFDCQTSATGAVTETAAFRDNSTNGNALQIFNGNNEARIRAVYYGTPSDQNITFWTITAAGNQGERMRITSGGNVLIGRTTSGLNNTEGVTISSGSIQPEGNSYVFYGNRTTSDGLFMGIRRNNVDVGSITVTTSATAFNTSSDYRLKQDLKEFNGLSIINSIKTYDYEWKIDSTRAYGVIAHELEEILPYAVFGKKDEINENGNIKPQAVDYSKLVPILIKSIQELEARIKQLENK
jgi:hypothetical protein